MTEAAASFVKLHPGVPVKFRSDRWWWDEREIVDPFDQRRKKVKIMVFHITEIDGNVADTTFSALSFKLQSTLAPMIDSGALFYRQWRITHNPRGYATEYGVELL